jgi:hypothetical protein
MTDSKDDPRPMIDGTNEVIDAVLDRLIAPSAPKPTIKKPEAPAVPTLLNRLLERVPVELRDKVTIQVGANKVKRPGQEGKLNAKQAQAIALALDDPTKHTGSLKILGEKNEVLMQLVDNNFTTDKIGFSQKQELKVDAPTVALTESPTEAVAPEIAPAVAKTELTASPTEVATLIATIERLESRVAALEAKIEPQPATLRNNVVGNWLNNQRDKIAEVVRTNVDKVSVKGHAIADKIAATKQSVKDTVVTAADDIKQSITDAKTTVVEGADLVKNVAVQGAQQIINDGMSRHYDAMDAMTGSINQKASSIADNARDVMEDPRQAFFDKALQPVAQRMFEAAEKMPDKVTLDSNGNKSISVGPYTYSKEQTGIVMRREGEVVTRQNLTPNDVQAVDQMKTAFPKPEIKQQIAPPKITGLKMPGPKHKVSV